MTRTYKTYNNEPKMSDDNANRIINLMLLERNIKVSDRDMLRFMHSDDFKELDAISKHTTLGILEVYDIALLTFEEYPSSLCKKKLNLRRMSDLMENIRKIKM